MKAFFTSHLFLLLQNTRKSNQFLSTSCAMTKNIVIDPFSYRQFAEHESSKDYGGTVFSLSIQDFEDIINEQYDESKLKNGYAPFCKHLFIPNTSSDVRVNVLQITADNEHLIRTKYEARTELELPVLIRYFPKEAGLIQSLPVAKYLDLILYSRDQINKENAAMNKKAGYESSAPWGVVGIKAQDVDYEIPMNPITMMRNALGKEHGGSGVPLNREEYEKSYIYWKDHAVVS